MNRTGIEYLDYTWNPIIMRCSPVSEGCTNCWHIKRADMFAANPKIPKALQEVYTGDIPPVLIRERLDDPIKRKKPARIGVQFMGDLFHPDVRDDQINSVFLRMLFVDWHTYIILTKRIDRAKDFMSIGTKWRQNMPHVWPGVTIENDKHYDRLEALLKIPAAVRWVSFEPLLSRIKAAQYAKYLDWAVIGCESGSGRRHTDIEWIEDLKDTFVLFNKPVFVKQAEIGGKLIKMPMIDGKMWDQYPKKGAL